MLKIIIFLLLFLYVSPSSPMDSIGFNILFEYLKGMFTYKKTPSAPPGNDFIQFYLHENGKFKPLIKHPETVDKLKELHIFLKFKDIEGKTTTFCYKPLSDFTDEELKQYLTLAPKTS